MALGLGLGLQHGVAIRKYVLDYTTGCIFGKSLYLLTNKYKGYCIEIQRQSDNTVLNIGFNYALKNPFVNSSLIESFCAGTNGRVKTWYDQLGGSSGIQTNWDNMPVICTNGTFESNGIKFIASSSMHLICDSYAAVEITTAPISYYGNYYNTSSHAGYIFTKNNILTDRNMGLYCNLTNIVTNLYDYNIFTSAQNETGSNKVLFKWDTGTDNTKLNINGNVYAATPTLLVPYANSNKICIGARFNTYPAMSGYYNGHINTILIFNTNQYNNYSVISGGC